MEEAQYNEHGDESPDSLDTAQCYVQSSQYSSQGKERDGTSRRQVLGKCEHDKTEEDCC